MSTSEQEQAQFGHYFKDVAHLETIDVYRVLELFNVIDPCIQHAVKKLLCAGIRGVKDQSKDVQEAIASLNRFIEMRSEDAANNQTASPKPPKIEWLEPKTGMVNNADFCKYHGLKEGDFLEGEAIKGESQVMLKIAGIVNIDTLDDGIVVFDEYRKCEHDKGQGWKFKKQTRDFSLLHRKWGKYNGI